MLSKLMVVEANFGEELRAFLVADGVPVGEAQCAIFEEDTVRWW